MQTAPQCMKSPIPGMQPMDHHTGLPSSTTAISSRAEPMRTRMPLTDDPADSGEDISL